MRYSYEFKRKCVELYRQGIWPDTPANIKERSFRGMVRIWVRTEDIHGPEALHHSGYNKNWTPEEKLDLVAQVLAGQSSKSVAISAGISRGLLYQWVRKYKLLGYNGLVNQKKGRPGKELPMKMKANIDPKPLTESEREELIRLRAEVEYMRAENEVIKKEIALREEKQAARLKAKKQRSSKNFEKKASN